MQLNNRIGARCRVGNQWKKFVQELLSGFTDKSECDYYNLCRDVVVMRRSKQTELVTEGLIASTTDDLNQTVHQTVNNKYTSFWSSCGDATEDGEDSVCYLLAGEGCVVDEVSVCSDLHFFFLFIFFLFFFFFFFIVLIKKYNTARILPSRLPTKCTNLLFEVFTNNGWIPY